MRKLVPSQGHGGIVAQNGKKVKRKHERGVLSRNYRCCSCLVIQARKRLTETGDE